ncbi:MAG: hypothetical protein XE11_2488 [Methanomicrobiales archaeon 53_19]|nr:MAG: hypothetical protein XE11_2488 [Methanomicrobiales archaeon 53_19]
MVVLAFLCSFLITSTVSATEYVLNGASIEQFKNGIRYDGEGGLIIEIEDDVTIAGNSNAGIESAAPVTIRSSAGRTLTIVVDSDEEFLYGIGLGSTYQRGGSNTFGLDGGEVETENADDGVIISGGQVVVNSSGGAARNYGIDSKFGTVKISGDAVVFIREDESGRADNFAYNENVTTISGGNAMVFASEGGNYILREDAVLTQNATLLPGGTFEIPAGRTLDISGRAYLAQPAGATLLFGEGYGAFEYAGSIPESGMVIYAGEAPIQQAAVPVAGLLAGLGAAVLLRRKH